MAGLQRSAASFRRQGSSGLVWDDKFLSRELMNPGDSAEIGGDHTRGTPDVVLTKLDRSRSSGEEGRRYPRTMRESPRGDPPSPRLPTCWFCSVFRKPKHGGWGKPGKAK